MDSYDEALAVMTEQFGHDTVVSLATVRGSEASVRTVNAYYRQGAFYVTTYALSTKMTEIAVNPSVAICHDLFVAHGIGTNLGSPVSARNIALAEELRRAFCAFWDRHVNESDPHTCILKVALSDAVVFTQDTKYLIDFVSRSAQKQPFVNDIIV